MLTGAADFQNLPDGSWAQVVIYKNGVAHKAGTVMRNGGFSDELSQVSAIVQANGTSDYFELYGVQASGGARNVNGGASQTYFNGALIGGGGGGGGGSSANYITFSGNDNIGGAAALNTDVKLWPDSVVTDSASAYNSGTHQYIVPTTCDYMIAAHSSMTQSVPCPSCYGRVRVYRNGGLIMDGYDDSGGSGGWLNPHDTRIVPLTAGDQIELYVHSGNSAAINATGGLNLSCVVP